MRNGVWLRHPASVLGPESALGLLPSITLSSAQAECDCNGDAPYGEVPFKTDSFMLKFSGSPILGLSNAWI